MTRPPFITLLFLAAPIAFLAYGALSSRSVSSLNVESESHGEAVEAPTATAETPTTESTTIAYGSSFDPRNPYASETVSGADTPFDPADDYWGLPRTEGVDLVAGLCSSCHSLEIVMQQRMTPDRWDYTLNWMMEKQGMVRLDEAQYDMVYAYLTSHFSSSAGDN